MSEASLRRRLWRIAPVVLDVVVAVVVIFLTTHLLREIGAMGEPGARSPDAIGYGLLVVGGAALLGRRAWPIAVLATLVADQLLFHLLGYPGPGPFPALLVGLFTVAGKGRRAAAFVVGAGVALWSAAGQVLGGGASLLQASVVGSVAATAAAVFLGDAVHSRRAYLREVRERLRRAENERELEAQRRVAEERLRIARELHDVVAHTIAVVTVQAGVAVDMLDERPDEARAALHTIRKTSREAMAELKATIGVLRQGNDGDAPRAPAPGLEQVGDLIEMARHGGLQVQLAVEGEARQLAASVDLTCYRILQESLTNVLRHADATTAEVAIRYEPDFVEIEVADNGRGAPSAGDNGHGISGMRERTTALGGSLQAAPGRDGGFTVRARLPVEAQA